VIEAYAQTVIKELSRDESTGGFFLTWKAFRERILLRIADGDRDWKDAGRAIIKHIEEDLIEDQDGNHWSKGLIREADEDESIGLLVRSTVCESYNSAIYRSLGKYEQARSRYHLEKLLYQRVCPEIRQNFRNRPPFDIPQEHWNHALVLEELIKRQHAGTAIPLATRYAYCFSTASRRLTSLSISTLNKSLIKSEYLNKQLLNNASVISTQYGVIAKFHQQ